LEFVSYEYKCATTDGDHVDKTLDEWAAAGWELQTASTVLFHGGKETFYHSLFFRRLKVR
jgi:hypothetical protein